jgi:hypothetical protein
MCNSTYLTHDAPLAVMQAEASKWLEVNARLVYAAKLLVDDCKQSGVPSDAAEQQVCRP